MTVKRMALLGALLLPALGCASSSHDGPAPDHHSSVFRRLFLALERRVRGSERRPPRRHEVDVRVGGGGWGNQELETYTDRARNASLDGEGVLAIQALRESFTGTDGITREYTSARLKTQGKFEQAYGRFEARLRIPRGQGLWPAFWMLGADIATAGWPRCGEIDVMENIGREPSTVHGAAHGPGYSGGNGIGAPFTLSGGARFADDFHVFAVEWEPAAIRLVRGRHALPDAHPGGSARGPAVGLRPPVLRPAERRGGRKLAGQPRRDHGLSAGHARGLRPRVSASALGNASKTAHRMVVASVSDGLRHALRSPVPAAWADRGHGPDPRPGHRRVDGGLQRRGAGPPAALPGPGAGLASSSRGRRTRRRPARSSRSPTRISSTGAPRAARSRTWPPSGR